MPPDRPQLSCNEQTVRNAIHAFNAAGPAALPGASSAAHTTTPSSTRPAAEQLRALLHRSPRDFGKPTSLWTLDLAAEVAHRAGADRRAGQRRDDPRDAHAAGRALAAGQDWITSPDPAYARKKGARPPDPLGARPPRLGPRLRGRGLVEPPGPARPCTPGPTATGRCGWSSRRSRKDDPDPKALACYGLLLRAADDRPDAGCASSTAARSAR